MSEDRTGPANPTRPDLIGAAIACGFGAAVVMWVTTWFFHLPGLEVDPVILLPLLALVLVVSGWIAGGWRAGLAAGLVSALINLIALGTALSESPEEIEQMTEVANDLRDGALLTTIAYLFSSTAVGAFGGWLRSMLSPRINKVSPAAWLAGLGVIGAVAFVPLLGIGGAVTSTDSGLAVPEPFNAYGSLPFLLPLSVMAGEPRIFFEHSHRLFGMLVGVTWIAIVVRTWMVDRRLAAKLGVTGVLTAVIIQGLLGALRVGTGTEAVEAGSASRIPQVLAMLHGVSGQLVFAFGVALAVVLRVGAFGDETTTMTTRRAARAGWTWTVIAGVLVVFQLLTGAATRHLGDLYAGWTHAGFSVFVAVGVVIAAMILRSADGYSFDGRQLRRIGGYLVVVVCLQFILGFLTIGMVGIGSGGENIPGARELRYAGEIRLWTALIPTMHQTLGALIIALITAALVWTRAIRATA